MSTSSPFDTNDLNMSGSVQPRSKSIMLSRQDSSDVSNEMLSSPDYASVLFHSSWASNNEAVTRSLQLNHINNDNINNNNNMNMDNNNNNIKSQNRLSLSRSREKNNDNNKNNTNLICVNGKEENNSLEDKTEINQSTNKTMPNANFTGSDKNEKVIKRKISNTTPNSDLGESTTLKKNEKPRRSLKKTCSLSESDVQELEQTAAFTRQNSLPESYCTSSMLAKYQSSIILQNPLIYNDNDMDYESTCTQNGYVRELKAQLQAALDREACLRQMLASREADYDQKQRILNRKNQFLIAEIRELATIKHMFTDHANKMTKYIQRLNMEGCKWRREYVKLLQACLGATQTDPHHRLMFSDYGKDRVSNKE
ncbi:unnamed protein product [Trichobilharzia regenti]|nr:unnamed protein product [Trichobilharzia regenti]